LAGFVHALDLTFTGEIRTGILWERVEDSHLGVIREETGFASIWGTEHINNVRLRLDMHLVSDNLGLVMRLQPNNIDAMQVSIPFVFAYGNFLDERLRVTIGRLERSPWRADGPHIWQQLDTTIGIRTEIFPAAIPGFGFGFAINHWNNATYHTELLTIDNLLMESVFGFTYTNDLFHARLGYRLDSDADVDPGGSTNEGHELMYRLEASFLSNLVPGLSVWANGWWRGFIGSTELVPAFYQNWLYVQFDPEDFFTRLSLGLRFTESLSHHFDAEMEFYYRVLPFLNIGGSVFYNLEFGPGRSLFGVPFRFLAGRPRIQAHFGNASISLEYEIRGSYLAAADRSLRQRTEQWLNLRAEITF